MYKVASIGPDILGDDYEMMTLAMGRDYEGDVIATLVRRTSYPAAHQAVLYVHGYNDYFFQKHVADFYIGLGFNFYALDLRKHGRSLLPHQSASLCRSLWEYYPEIDAAVELIKRDGHRSVIINGHSTGGLIVSLWTEDNRGRDGVDALVLNSPYLSSGIPPAVQLVIDPIARAITRSRPAATFPLRLSPHYTRSLHHLYNGEWSFNTNWKSTTGTPLRPAWLAGVHKGQRRVHKGLDIRVPILVMCGTESGNRRTLPPDMLSADTVLNTDQIARLSTQLGRNVTCIRISGAMHDVFLSPLPARQRAFDELSRWLVAYTADANATDDAASAPP